MQNFENTFGTKQIRNEVITGISQEGLVWIYFVMLANTWQTYIVCKNTVSFSNIKEKAGKNAPKNKFRTIFWFSCSFWTLSSVQCPLRFQNQKVVSMFYFVEQCIWSCCWFENMSSVLPNCVKELSKRFCKEVFSTHWVNLSLVHSVC